MDPESVCVRHRIGNRHVLVAGKAVLAVGDKQCECDKILALDRFPDFLVCARVVICMQVVGAVVDGKMIRHAVKRKLRARRAVCNRRYQCAEKAAVYKIAVRIVISEDDVLHRAVLVRDAQIDKRRTVINDTRADVCVLNCISVNILAAFGLSEKFFLDTHFFCLSLCFLRRFSAAVFRCRALRAACVPQGPAEASPRRCTPGRRRPERRWQSG